MRILSVTPYHDPEGGGLERYAHEVNARLARRHEVTALAFSRGADVGLVPRDGVQRITLRPKWVLGNTPIDPGLQGHVQGLLRRLRPDVVVAHTPVPFPAEMAYRAAEAEGIPFVATYHAGSLRGSSAPLQAAAWVDRRTFERRMLAGAQALIAVSPYARDHALRHHRAKATVIPPGVDAALFTPRPDRVRRGVVTFAGPLSRSYRWKGVDVLWEAMRRLRGGGRDVRLRLVGDGDRRPHFESRAAELDGRVEFTGRLGVDGFVAALQSSDVVVLPSTTDAESFGMVLAEANACGRPVVASAVGGIPSFVTDGENGLLAQPGDPKELAACIAQLLDDPVRADSLGARGRAKVLAAHDWDDVARRTEGVLAAVVGKAPVAVASRA